jgi:hypothetical protein
MHPPRSKPTRVLAMAPEIPAMIRDIIISIILLRYLLNNSYYKVYFIKLIINFDFIQMSVEPNQIKNILSGEDQ